MTQIALTSDELNNLMTLVSVGKQSFDSLNWKSVAEQLYCKLGSMRHAIDNPQDYVGNMQRRINSIGWLNSVNGIALTPCVDGNMHALRIEVTYEEFEHVRHDDNAMKKLAATKIIERRSKAGTP